jgi:two-component system NtrC family response regulator
MRSDPAAGARVLIVDGDATARRGLQQLLASAGCEVTAVASGAAAREATGGREPALVLIEAVLPDGDGLALLSELKALWPALPVIVLTAYPEPRSIVEAMRRGALDYLTKPADPEELRGVCESALARRAPQAGPAPVAPPPIVGDSAATARVRAAVGRLAQGRVVGVLVTGEDGVGKTWIAQALHASSARRAAPCLPFPCAAPHEPMIALFGPADASEGAHATGLLAAAGTGTVLLDDADRLPGEVQSRLLEWAERSERPSPLLIGLTTREEPASPLLAWLGRVTISIPPLRERIADILPLARHFLARDGQTLARRFEGFTPSAEHRLLRHPWPGNVAELARAVERAAHGAPGGSIGPEHLDLGSLVATPAWTPAGEPRPLREVADAYIDYVLTVTGGNRTRAAQVLGVARETLRSRMRSRVPV